MVTISYKQLSLFFSDTLMGMDPVIPPTHQQPDITKKKTINHR